MLVQLQSKSCKLASSYVQERVNINLSQNEGLKLLFNVFFETFKNI